MGRLQREDEAGKGARKEHVSTPAATVGAWSQTPVQKWEPGRREPQVTSLGQHWSHGQPSKPQWLEFLLRKQRNAESGNRTQSSCVQPQSPEITLNQRLLYLLQTSKLPAERMLGVQGEEKCY